MSESFANSVLGQKMRSPGVRSEVVAFGGGVNTEDQYGGRLGQGALIDCHNIDISDSGYKTKGGWVRFGPQSFASPLDKIRVIYCKYAIYPFTVSSFTMPADHTLMTNFNGSGEDIYLLSWRWNPILENAGIPSVAEVMFVVFPNQNTSIFTGSTLGTRDGGADPYLYFSSGPYGIESLGNDPIDQQYETIYDPVPLVDTQAYVVDAYDSFRSAVTSPVIGDGSCIGTFIHKDEVYVVCGTTGGFCYLRRLASGASPQWTTVEDCRIIYFSGGTRKPEELSTVSGATSGATATLGRVVVCAGSWDAGDARGYISLSGLPTGTFVAEVLRSNESGSPVAFATSVSYAAAIVQNIPLGVTSTAKFRYAEYNFSGHEDRSSIYFVTGSSYAFEFWTSGANYIFTPIKTLIGIDDIDNWTAQDTEDVPRFIAANRNTLFLAYDGGSIQNSSAGDPLDFRAVVGYDEKNIGEDVTNFFPEIGGSLLVSARNTWWAVYGDQQQNYDIQLISSDAGALEDSGSALAGLVFIDAQGITTIKQVTDFGNWSINSLTREIDTKMRELIKNCTPVKTIAIRNSALLRFIFNQTSSESSVSIDGTESPPSVWVSMKVGTGGADGFTFGAYNKKIIDICEGEITIDPDLPPSREVFFVASDGYLYRDEVSCVADNEELKSSIDTAVLLARSPQMVKHWQEMYLIAECVTGGDVEVTVSYHDETGYRRSAPSRSVELSTGVIYWDTIDWDYANWDTIGHNKVRVKLSGLGDAISFGMTSSKFLQDPDYYKALQINFIPTESRRHR